MRRKPFDQERRRKRKSPLCPIFSRAKEDEKDIPETGDGVKASYEGGSKKTEWAVYES